MSKALGFAAMIIVIAIFLPSVLHSLETFLLLLLQRATSFVQALPASQSAEMFQNLR